MNEYFEKFIKKEEKKQENKNVWIYTRVSSKDQEANLSLENQKEYAYEYVKDNNLIITEEFGETYESASGDFTRKEFSKLIHRLKNVKNTKEKPFAILIYKMSRFSRTGGNAISLAEKIVNEYKVHLIETISGIDTSTEIGKFEIWEKLLQAKKENITRLEFTLPGMKKFLEKGNYLGKPPIGYTLLGTRTNDFKNRREKQELVINEEGELLKKAWKWKLSGERDYIILNKLKNIGLIISKQKLSRIWKNPTYCSISTNKLLEKPVKGNWKSIISEIDFLKVQKILDKNNSGYKVDKTNENRPLTKHLYCSKCGRSLTGYEVKKKGIHYYKCQICKGVTLNANTTKKAKNKGAHQLYEELLKKFELDSKLIPLFKKQLKITYSTLNGDNAEEEKALIKQLKKSEKKEETLIDKLLEGVFSDEVYKNQKEKIEKEKNEIIIELKIKEGKISNLNNFVKKSISISKNLSNYWSSGDYTTKIKVQDLVFSDGVVYNAENRQYLTKNKNVIFEVNQVITREVEGQKKDFSEKIPEKSHLVARLIKKSNQIRFRSDAKKLIEFYKYLKNNGLLID